PQGTAGAGTSSFRTRPGERDRRDAWRRSIPTASLSQQRDVSHVVSSVPGVMSEQLIDTHDPEIRMSESPGELALGEGLPKHDPTLVEGLQQIQRRFQRSLAYVGKLRPLCSVISLDRGLRFG